MLSWDPQESLIRRFLRWFFGGVFPEVNHSNERRRALYVCVTAFGAACLNALLLVAEFDEGFAVRPYIQTILLVVSAGLFVIARMGKYHATLVRIYVGAIFFSVFVQILYEQDANSLFYLLFLPPVTTLLFGVKEGVVWSILAGVIVLPFLAVPAYFSNPLAANFYIYYSIAYLSMSILAPVFESLRVHSREMLEAERDELIKTQEELAKSEARFRAFSELASDWLFEMDENLVYTYVTPKLLELLGADVLGQKFSELSRQQESASLLGMEGQEIKNHQVSFINYEGNRIIALFSATPVYSKDGKLKGYIGAGKDITNIKQAEEELREKEKSLHHNQKLEALGQLTSGVAHDFNNLLTVVGGNLELLENASLPTEHRRKVEASARAVSRAAQLTKQLLSYARKQELDPQPIKVDDLVARLSEIFSRTLGGTVDFQTECSTEVWLCQADEGQLETAVLNLALNARDAMSGKGQLVLRAKNHVQIDSDQSLRQGEYVRLSVGDTGVGIEEDEMARISEPFYTSKPAGQGTGLGLSMIYGFAQQSGGCLEIESQPGIGSIFSILLPRAVGLPIESPVESFVSGPLDQCTVMVVEDDLGVLNVIILILKSIGIDVVTAPSGEKALQMLDSLSVDLVISDLMLGQGMSGVEVAETMSDRWPDMPLLLISGNADHLLSKSELEQHKRSLLRKPFGNQQLIAAVRGKLNQQQDRDIAI